MKPGLVPGFFVGIVGVPDAATALLWAGPAVLLLIGLGLLVQHIRARQRLDANSRCVRDLAPLARPCG